jgi:hypothetical protein
MSDVLAEGEWLASLGERPKAAFLVTLARELTIAGRASYVPQTEELLHPTWLRQVNEVQHRVLACLSEVLAGTGSASFQRSIAEWVLNQRDSSLAEHMAHAWARAKERTRQ